MENIINEFFLELPRSKIYNCVQCGKCVASCPAGRFSRMRIRGLVHDLYFGKLKLEEIMGKHDIWLCTTCYMCYQRCPKEVNTVHVILKLRNLMAKTGKHPEIHKTAISNIYLTGSSFPPSDEITKIRSVLGLHPKPKDVASNAESMNLFRKLLQVLPISKFIGELCSLTEHLK